MDRVTLLDQLSGHEEFSETLLQTLGAVQNELNEFIIERHSLPIFIEQLIDKLIPLSCETFTKTSRSAKLSKLENKTFEEALLDRIAIILVKLCYKSEVAAERVVEVCMQHLEEHPVCTSLYLLLIRLVSNSEQVRFTAKEMEVLSICVAQLESICGNPMQPASNSAPSKPLHNRKNSYSGPFLRSPSIPNAPPEYRTTLNKSIVSEGESFMLELPMLYGHTVSSRALRRAARERVEESRPRSPVVPVLNLPQEDSFRDKSASYRSRFSGFSGSWGDQTPVNASPFPKLNNASQVFDFESSFIAEESTNMNEVVPPSKVMYNLAMQLGEACLTADLTALLAQKRDSELEKAAKRTVFPANDLEKSSQNPDKKLKHKLRQRSNSLSEVKRAQKTNRKPHTHFHKLRAALLTLVNHLLQMYDPFELQFVRSPQNILVGHILSEEFSGQQAILSMKAQENAEFSDDETEIFEEELGCSGEDKHENNEQENLQQLKEEAEVVPSNTVPGMSPRGAYAQKQSSQNSLNYSVPFADDSSELELAFYKIVKSKELLIPEHKAIFTILNFFAQHTESIHKAAVTPYSSPFLSGTFTNESPKRSPNCSLGFSMLVEEALPKETPFWVQGIAWQDLPKEKLRKKSDLAMFRLHRRLSWAQENFSGTRLFELENEVLKVLSKYLRACASRVTFFQAVDLMFENLLSTKKRLIEMMEWSSCPPSSGQNPAPNRQVFASLLSVVSQLLLQSHTTEAYKLLSDVFVANDTWNETVRTFAASVIGENVRQEARSVVKYFNAIAIFCRKIVNEIQLEKKSSELNPNQKNWKECVCRVLNGLVWLLSPSYGVIPKYLQKHNPEIKSSKLHPYSPPPRYTHITRAILELLINLFWFSPRFTCFRNEEFALYYIRMHYISFLKLYSNNQPFSKKEDYKLNATTGKSGSSLESPQPSAYLKSCLLLSKIHLKALFAYARNRTPDVTRKFFQFRILEFLTREIDLEYDITLRREKFIRMHKAEKKKITQKFQKEEVKVPPASAGNPVPKLNMPKLEEQAKKPSIPALKINLLSQDPEKKEMEKQEFVKAMVKEPQKTYGLTRIQKSLDGTSKFHLALDKPNPDKKDLVESQEICKEKEFYEQQRRQREIYSDEELQTCILGLIFCLLLTPTRGTLEELYCSQYPINNGIPNVLFLLHYHLNHPSNQHILPKLQKLITHVVPPLAGQRLLKLLASHFFDPTIYSSWHKIATGAYGTVYECKTGLPDPPAVAIKKMSVPKTIYDRCVLHDIFTEITCLEEFRLEKGVTDLFDYGVDENDYYIVMKRYPISLKQWREQLSGSLEEHLPKFLTVYREILKAVKIIHKNNVTHYDLKCDNVFLEDPIEECQITIGDFGECRMFINSEDETCLRNKGTEYIKSPEMLDLTRAARKDNDKFDRRRKVGTTRASDIWSLGCLLYELLTGEFLFYHQDWVVFYIRCTSYKEELLKEENLEKLNGNVYLVDFLKYMLMRDPRHRPTIDSALNRFEHIHALLVSAPSVSRRPPSAHQLRSFSELEQVLEVCVNLRSGISGNRIKSPRPSLLRITHDLYLCSQEFFKQNTLQLMKLGITHVVHAGLEDSALKIFQHTMVGPAPLQSLPGVMDFLRSAHLANGRVLFVENEKLWIIEGLLVCLSEIFNTSFFEAWSLVKSQVLFIDVPLESLTKLSIWTLQQRKIKDYLGRYPRYQCLCGSCTIILKRHLADPKYQVTRSCNCSRQFRNVDTAECPSPGCGDFISQLKDLHSLSWNSLNWGFAERDDFLIGPFNEDKAHEQVILSSFNLDANAELFRVVEKRPWRSGIDQWALYRCKVCSLWMFAISNDESRVAYLMNVNVSGDWEGIMSGGQSVPVLSRIKLPLLVQQQGSHMVKPKVSYVSTFTPSIKNPNPPT